MSRSSDSCQPARRPCQPALRVRVQGGRIEAVYDDRLRGLFQRVSKVFHVERASHVEPTVEGAWTAEMVAGPVLGPFSTRSEALAAERAWLREERGL